jgi:diguanylate cyclase (GGDEF)-like protein
LRGEARIRETIQISPANLLAAMKRTVDQLAAFNDIAKALTSTLEVSEVLQLVMQKVSELLKPQNWSLLLYDENERHLFFQIAVGAAAEKLKKLRIAPGEGIAGQVFVSGSPKLVRNVATDPQFAKRFDEASGFPTQSVIAVPLKSHGKVLGVMELVTGADQPLFTDEDLSAAQGMADYIAIAIENARNFQRVQELTISDEHTGLFNARHLRNLLEVEVARSNRFHHPLSLLFLDLDRFKQVNDTHGHLVGSALLREVGQLLVSNVRTVDSCYRYGGDEFAVMLIETDAAGAKKTADRILEGFRKATFLAERGLSLRLSASIGVATFPSCARTGVELLQAADGAMYAAKEAGRDQVKIAGLQPAPISPA